MKLLPLAAIFFSVNCLADVPGDITVQGSKIIATHHYQLGDNDTQQDAKNLCFLEAKRKAVEYAGSYVESTVEQSQTNSSSTGKTQMKSISAALVSAELTSADTGVENGKVYIDCTVEVQADKKTLNRQIKSVAEDKKTAKQIETQQETIGKLEAQIARIQQKLINSGPEKTIQLRKERSVVFDKLQEENDRKFEIVSRIDKQSADLSNNIRIGMTGNELLEIMGNPTTQLNFYGHINWNYGAYWIQFAGGVVCGYSKEPIVVCGFEGN